MKSRARLPGGVPPRRPESREAEGTAQRRNKRTPQTETTSAATFWSVHGFIGPYRSESRQPSYVSDPPETTHSFRARPISALPKGRTLAYDPALRAKQRAHRGSRRLSRRGRAARLLLDDGGPLTNSAARCDVATRSLTRSQPRSFASMALLNRARSRTRPAAFNCCRMAQTSREGGTRPSWDRLGISSEADADRLAHVVGGPLARLPRAVAWSMAAWSSNCVGDPFDRIVRDRGRLPLRGLPQYSDRQPEARAGAEPPPPLN